MLVSAGEVSSGVLTRSGKKYLVVVGEHPRGDSNNGVTMIYDIENNVRHPPPHTMQPDVCHLELPPPCTTRSASQAQHKLRCVLRGAAQLDVPMHGRAQSVVWCGKAGVREALTQRRAVLQALLCAALHSCSARGHRCCLRNLGAPQGPVC